MDKIDIAFFIILGVALLRGFFKGLVYELISLFSVIAAILCSLFLSVYVSPLLTSIGLSDKVALYSTGVIIFLAVILIVNIVCKLIFSTNKIKALGLFDNLIGAIISCIKYSIMLCVILVIINTINDNYHIYTGKQIEGSFMYNGYLDFAQKIYNLIK